MPVSGIQPLSAAFSLFKSRPVEVFKAALLYAGCELVITGASLSLVLAPFIILLAAGAVKDFGVVVLAPMALLAGLINLYFWSAFKGGFFVSLSVIARAGQHLKFFDYLDASFGQSADFFLVELLKWLIPGLVLVLAFAAALLLNQPTALLIALVPFAIVALIFNAFFNLVFPAVVVDRVSAIDGIRRGIGAIFRAPVAYLVTFLIVSILFAVVEAIPIVNAVLLPLVLVPLSDLAWLWFYPRAK